MSIVDAKPTCGQEAKHRLYRNKHFGFTGISKFEPVAYLQKQVCVEQLIWVPQTRRMTIEN